MVAQNMLRALEKKWVFSKIKKKIRFATALDLNKCLRLINMTISLCRRAPISKLPSNISTMIVNSSYILSETPTQR